MVTTADGYVGDLLQPQRLEESVRLRRQRATLAAVLEELERGVALVPPDAGTFWHSDAHRAYARRLQELRRTLAHAHAALRDALSSIDAALAGSGTTAGPAAAAARTSSGG